MSVLDKFIEEIKNEASPLVLSKNKRKEFEEEYEYKAKHIRNYTDKALIKKSLDDLTKFFINECRNDGDTIDPSTKEAIEAGGYARSVIDFYSLMSRYVPQISIKELLIFLFDQCYHMDFCYDIDRLIIHPSLVPKKYYTESNEIVLKDESIRLKEIYHECISK